MINKNKKAIATIRQATKEARYERLNYGESKVWYVMLGEAWGRLNQAYEDGKITLYERDVMSWYITKIG